MWDGHDSADRSCTALMSIPGAVGHYFCEAVRRDLILGDLVFGHTGSYGGHVHHRTRTVVAGSRRAGRSCWSWYVAIGPGATSRGCGAALTRWGREAGLGGAIIVVVGHDF